MHSRYGSNIILNGACRETLKINANNYQSMLEGFQIEGENNLFKQIEEQFKSLCSSRILCKNFIRKNSSERRDSLYKVFIIDQTLEQSQKTLALVFRDLTPEIEEKRVQQQFQQLLFLSISHEVRTPLNAIQGLIAVLGGIEGLVESLRLKVKAGKSWCSILSSEISNVLDYAPHCLWEISSTS